LAPNRLLEEQIWEPIKYQPHIFSSHRVTLKQVKEGRSTT
jgi:hypothetical protein